jgi:molybdopterin molybdotransferase
LARLKGFQKLTSVDEALHVFFDTVKTKELKAVNVSLGDALNRVLAEEVIAREDLPRFDRSAVDGYAVRAEDTLKASQFKPKTLKLIDKSEVSEKQVKKIWTGNPIPKGANAVVMLENIKALGDKVEVQVSLTPGENVSKKGEDVRKGEVAVKAGSRLKPHHLGLIAALGISSVQVFEKPKIAVLATGNELVEADDKPHIGQVFEVNRLVISALCRELDAEPLNLGIAKDDLDEIRDKLKTGLKMADVAITTGGTSVGVSDLVPEAVNKIGNPGLIVHGIAMRPAMPTALAVANEKPIIILSGNPVAAMFGFEVFARPLICKLLGLKKEETRPMVKAEITKKVTSALGRKTFVRVHVFQRNTEFFAEPISARGSSIISSMTKANGYVVVPENREGLTRGESVLVRLFDNVEVG